MLHVIKRTIAHQTHKWGWITISQNEVFQSLLKPLVELQ